MLFAEWHDWQPQLKWWKSGTNFKNFKVSLKAVKSENCLWVNAWVWLRTDGNNSLLWLAGGRQVANGNGSLFQAKRIQNLKWTAAKNSRRFCCSEASLVSDNPAALRIKRALMKSYCSAKLPRKLGWGPLALPENKLKVSTLLRTVRPRLGRPAGTRSAVLLA